MTWFDQERMEGNIIDQMTDGIDESACVIVCITRNYIEKVSGDNGPNDNCKCEFEYARLRKGPTKRLLPLVMEESCKSQTTWAGSVGFALGVQLYVDLRSDRQMEWDKGVEDCIQRIKAMVFN